jgi:hypothetical protein
MANTDLIVSPRLGIMERRPDMFDKVLNAGKKKFADLQTKYKTSRMKDELRNQVTLANAYLAKGVKKGDPIYEKVYTECMVIVDKYFPSDPAILVLNMSSPAMKELKSWVDYDAEEAQIRTVKQYALAVVAGALSIGFVSGLIEVGFHMITFWIHSH